MPRVVRIGFCGAQAVWSSSLRALTGLRLRGVPRMAPPTPSMEAPSGGPGLGPPGSYTNQRGAGRKDVQPARNRAKQSK
eukprot:14432226-Alexandrium_andersonii.AAC.1